MQVSSTLPDGVTLGAQLKSLEDTGSGLSVAIRLHRAVVKGGKATFKIDGWDASSIIPRGKYEVSVTYFPLWVENERFEKKGTREYVTLDLPGSLVGDSVAYRDIISSRKRYDALNDLEFMTA